MKTFLINLDRSPERLQYMAEMLAGLGISFTRISAVDGTVIDRPDCASPSLTLPEIGCFLSHRKIWERMVSEEIPVAFIVEDDVELSPDLPMLLDEQRWLPNGDFVVKLDTTDMRAALKKTGLKAPSQRDLMELHGRHCGTGGYLLSNTAARRLIDLSKTLTMPVDLFLFDAKQDRAADISIFQMIPAPINHKIVSEDVSGTEFETTIPKEHLMEPKRTTSRSEKLSREVGRIVRQASHSLKVILKLTSERHLKVKFR
ncbi:glycosyltransferase family 25 protein [uncultured Nitratireductor sp.]|uniref:glycosyltransferase family 25 protein n=1 Tax=uncultured Nitratireductor sp. TaxID=520953 RepID=UPI00260E07FA|nr:glycosyltransferase family 25 protein [uncultured Nitratireductor sp.]